LISEYNYLRIGKVTGSHSLQGRLRIYVITDILSRFAAGNEIIVYHDGKYMKRVVKDFKITKKRIGLLFLEGVNDRNSADALKGAELLISKEIAEEGRDDLDNSSFYYFDLIGTKVFLDDKEYGELIDIMEAGAGDIFIIKNGKDEEVLIPFMDEIVKTDRLEDGRIDIYPIEGMLDI